MNNLNIGKRLSLAFGTVLVMLIAIAYIGWSALADSRARIETVVNSNNVKIALGNRMLTDLNVIARSARNYIIYTDKQMQNTMRDRIDSSSKDFNAASDKMASMVRTEKARQLVSDITTRAPETLKLLGKVMEIVDAGKVADAPDFLRNSVQSQQDATFAALNAMIEYQESQNKAGIEKLNADFQFAVNFLIGAAVFACVAAGLLAWRITISITGPLNQAVTVAQTVAAGDLTHEIAVNGKDEVAQLQTALKMMTNSLADIVGQVRAGTETIGTASREIASGNLDLSSRTEEQASSLEETASSMEELTSTVKQNAENARQANTLADSASEVAVRGGAVVAQVVQTMGAINDSSRKIVDIISVIDGIAFQTNILALNAAVEAARAGEQGRGFAVVASEVRNLAQRSASAAKEIKELINDSVERVGEGAKLVDEAGVTMEEIVVSVKRVTDIMGEISLASQEQNAGIEQINQAIAQMDQVTQQNAALVEEAAAAAASMEEQAGHLAEVVDVFKVAGGPSAQSGRVAAPVKAVAKPKLRVLAGPATVPARAAVSRAAPVKAAPAGASASASASARSNAVTADSDWEEF